MVISMTVNKVISEVRALNRGEYSDEQLIAWLGRLEARIYTEIISTHESPDEKKRIAHMPAPLDTGRGTDNDGEYKSNDFRREPEDELFVPLPYSELYRHYLDAMIYLSNGESVRAQASSELFNSIYYDFARYYNSTHMPKGGVKITF